VGVFAAMMGSGLLVTGFMMIEAQNYFLDFQFYRVSRSDMDLAFQSERGRDALTEVRNLPGVDHAEPILNVGCTFIHGPYRRKGAITGLSPQARLTIPRDLEGQSIPLPDTGLVISRRLSEILHAVPGEKVTVIPVKGEKRPAEVVVAKVADSYLGLSAYSQIGYLSRLVNERFAMTGAQLVTDRDAQNTSQLHRELKRLPAVESIVYRREMIKTLTDTLLANQYVFISSLVVFAGVIFFGSIVNASVVNLAERQREVATLRALGYSQGQIGAMFLRESMLTTLAGTLLGLPVGYLLTELTAMSFNNDLIRLPVVTAPWIWAVTLAMSVLFALLAHGVVQWRIWRMDYLESLKVME
jgi:putative ABC transport system permease protein